jgi:hypothetical protein
VIKVIPIAIANQAERSSAVRRTRRSTGMTGSIWAML